jgi:ESCRT-I complex subunit VPS37
LIGSRDEQVQQLLSDERAFEQFFESLERVQSIREQEVRLSSGNRDLATANIAKAKEIETLRAEVAAKKHELQATRSEYDALALQKHELDKVCSANAMQCNAMRLNSDVRVVVAVL